jgi:hypothetical protein
MATACTPAPEQAAAAVRAALERDPRQPDPDFLDALTPASRDFVIRLAATGRFPDLRTRLLAALKDAKPAGADGLLRGADPAATLWFVRDGHGRRLDLALSGATFAGVREGEYPAPW